MPIAFHDLIGTAGVLLILFCYYMLQTGKLHSRALCYSLLNLIGASLVLFSLYFEFNFSAMLIEASWVLISIIGLFRYWKLRKQEIRNTHSTC